MFVAAKGFVALPKSVTPARISANINGAAAAVKAFTKEDIELLDGVAAAGKQKRLIMPPWGQYTSFVSDMVFCSRYSVGVDLGFRNWPGQNPLIL